jgi:ABC-type sugar transport system ATPase subunit
VLAGEVAPDYGHILIAGERVRFFSLREARRLDVALFAIIGESLVVFRDGRRVASAPAAAANLDWINDNMLGSRQREALRRGAQGRPPRAAGAKPVLEVEGGSLASVDAGIAFAPEDRQRQALVPTASVGHNITLSGVKQLATAGVVSAGRENSAVAEIVEALSMKLSHAGASIQSLSGGNQQNAIIGRAVMTKPTRGVDVGAKAEIFNLMRAHADAGLAVLFASLELPEILAVSDRILVLSRGRARRVRRIEGDGGGCGEGEFR